MLGFTREDVIEMIEYYQNAGKIHHTTEELMAIMSPWYNHYCFSEKSPNCVFNTVQVLYFIQQYLVESNITEELIDRNVRIGYNKLRHFIIIDKQGKPEINGNFSKLCDIIEKGSTHSEIQVGFPIDELKEPNNFISLLYFFGLLTLNGKDEKNIPILSIPNEMVKRLFYDYIVKTYDEIGTIKVDSSKYLELLSEMAYTGQWKELVEYIAGRMEASLGLRDLMNSEKAHQVFWNVYLGMNSLYNVYSEKELNQSFSDLTLIPLLFQNPGLKYSYIIEIKYIKPSEFQPEDPQKVQALKEEAEKQLNRYAEDEKFMKSIESTQLKKLVLIFCGNRLVYSGEANPLT